MERSVPQHSSLSSLGKPRDAKRRSSDGFFYPILTLMNDSYILSFWICQPATRLECVNENYFITILCSKSFLLWTYGLLSTHSFSPAICMIHSSFFLG